MADLTSAEQQTLVCTYCGGMLSVNTERAGAAYLTYERLESIECLTCHATWEPDGTVRDAARWVRWPDLYEPPADQAQPATTLTDDELAGLAQAWSWSRLTGDPEAFHDLLGDAVARLAARHAPAADHAATLDRVRALADWHDTKAEKARRFPGKGREAAMRKAAEVHGDAARRLRAALDGDTDQCGDPTCDDEHGGGA